MAVLWVVCGAGRGVGKTHLARALVAVLGDVVLAKQGHGLARSDKPPGLLHSDEEVARFLLLATHHAHAVLESNAAALRGLGDVVVYVEGQPTTRRPDADLLRAAAGIVLAPEAPLASWRAALERALPDPDLRQAVVEVLLGAVRWSPSPPLQARTKVWLELPGGHGLGKGVVELLALVDQTGTLREAARGAGMSYRHAWDLVRAAERQLGVSLIAAQPGGVRGGSSSLTALGSRLLGAHRQLDVDLAAFAARRLAELLPGGSGA